MIVERNRLAHLFLGSANATRAAYGGNVEFLVELVGGATKLGVKAHLSPEAGFGALLEEYTPQPVVPDLEQDKRFALQDLLRGVAERRWTVAVTRVGEDFDLTVSTDTKIADVDARLTVELLTRQGEAFILEAGKQAAGCFHDVALADITPLLLLTAELDGLREASVVPAHLTGDPADRLDAVLARQVDTPEKFLRFLLLILGLANPGGTDEDGAGDGAGSWLASGGSAIFELLTRALADHPSTLDDLARIVDRLSTTDAGRAVMPKGFLELWQTVVEARRLLEVNS